MHERGLLNVGRKYSIRFVCQGGGLDVKAAFLAASLKHHLRCAHELVACIPEGDGVTPPAAGIVEFMQGVVDRIERIRNPINQHYPIGNKLACLAVDTRCDVRVFLDSDMLCLRPLHGFPAQGGAALCAKLEDWNHHSDDEWLRVYRFLGLGEPVMGHRSTVLDQPMPLYFNAGALVVDSRSDLPREWIAVARDMDRHLDLPRKHPNLDQLSLAGAVLKNGVSWALFGEEYNYPAELRPLDHTRIPYLCHYHDPVTILADAFLTGAISRLCGEYAALRTIADRSGQWVWSLPAASEPRPMHL